jgi:DNA-binding CsgD family transcriptional regulator
VPETIPLSDVRLIVHLLGEVARPDGADAATKKRLLLSGLARIVNADVWVWGQGRATADGGIVIFSYIDGGYASDRQREIAMRPDLNTDAQDVERRVKDTGGRHLTRTRAQLMTDEEWYGSSFYRDYRKAADLDDFLFSVYPLPPDAISVIGLHRNVAAPPFGDRERCIAHLVASEIDWLHRAGSDLPGPAHVADLTPRQRQVLLLLLSGDSRKQVARKLEISEHTVTDHMKALHRHFNVNSRGELLALFMSGGQTGG